MASGLSGESHSRIPGDDVITAAARVAVRRRSAFIVRCLAEVHQSETRSRCRGALVVLMASGLTLAGCSDDGEMDPAQTLPPIATTSATTVVATTLPEFYEIQQGDTLSEIADVYAIPVQQIMDANPEIASPDDLHVGQSIRIPARVGNSLPPPASDQTAPTLPDTSTVAGTEPAALGRITDTT